MDHEPPAPHLPDDPDLPVVPGGDATVTCDGPASDAGQEAARRGLRLLELVREVERHVAADGWDQNPRLFALAGTAELLALEPGLAPALDTSDPDSLTPIEQELDLGEQPLDEVLATTEWPDEVRGAALVLERLVLPPDAEDSLPDDDASALEEAVLAHPERQDVRMAVVVTRDGGRMCALRLRSHDDDAEVLVGDDLVPRLADALAATLT